MKHEINIENYQAYWIDYLDGKLSEGEEDLLFEFLEENTGIASTLIDADNYRLHKVDIKYPKKENLFSYNQTENIIISKIENVISEEEDLFIRYKIDRDKEVKKLYNLYGKTILHPDLDIVYPYKEKLKKTKKVFINKYIDYISAASVILIIVTGLIIYFFNKDLTGTALPVDIADSNKEIEAYNNYKTEINNSEDAISEGTDKKPVNIPNLNIVDNRNNHLFDRIDDLEKMPLTSIDILSVNNNKPLMEYRLDFCEKNEEILPFTFEYKKTEVAEEEIFYKKSFLNTLRNGMENIRNKFNIQETIDKMRETREDLLTTNFKKEVKDENN